MLLDEYEGLGLHCDPQTQLVVTCEVCKRPATKECWTCGMQICEFCTLKRHWKVTRCLDYSQCTLRPASDYGYHTVTPNHYLAAQSSGSPQMWHPTHSPLYDTDNTLPFFLSLFDTDNILPKFAR